MIYLKIILFLSFFIFCTGCAENNKRNINFFDSYPELKLLNNTDICDQNDIEIYNIFKENSDFSEKLSKFKIIEKKLNSYIFEIIGDQLKACGYLEEADKYYYKAVFSLFPINQKTFRYYVSKLSSDKFHFKKRYKLGKYYVPQIDLKKIRLMNQNILQFQFYSNIDYFYSYFLNTADNINPELNRIFNPDQYYLGNYYTQKIFSKIFKKYRDRGVFIKKENFMNLIRDFDNQKTIKTIPFRRTKNYFLENENFVYIEEIQSILDDFVYVTNQIKRDFFGDRSISLVLMKNLTENYYQPDRLLAFEGKEKYGFNLKNVLQIYDYILEGFVPEDDEDIRIFSNFIKSCIYLRLLQEQKEINEENVKHEFFKMKYNINNLKTIELFQR